MSHNRLFADDIVRRQMSVVVGRFLSFVCTRLKIEPDSDHVAKFDGDRPRDLGDWALNKKNITGET